MNGMNEDGRSCHRRRRRLSLQYSTVQYSTVQYCSGVVGRIVAVPVKRYKTGVVVEAVDTNFLNYFELLTNRVTHCDSFNQ